MSGCKDGLFHNGRSFVQDRVRYANAVVITLDFIQWAVALPPGTLTQKAKLNALTQSFKIAKSAVANIYTNSYYVFPWLMCMDYRECGLLMTEGQTIKIKDEILALLVVIWLSLKVVIIHSPRASKGGKQKSKKK